MRHYPYIVLSMPAVGSTFVWQILNELFPGEVLKEHTMYMRPSKSHVFLPYRDPRDLLCSHARRRLGGGTVKEALLREFELNFKKHKRHEHMLQLMKMPRVYALRYEHYFNGREKEMLDLMLEKVGKRFSENKKNEVIDKFSLHKNKERSERFGKFAEYDKTTMIHGNHISSNGKSGVWKDFFDKEMCELVKAELGDFLIKMDYEKDKSWGLD